MISYVAWIRVEMRSKLEDRSNQWYQRLLVVIATRLSHRTELCLVTAESCMFTTIQCVFSCMRMECSLSGEHLLIHASEQWRTLTIEETRRATLCFCQANSFRFPRSQPLLFLNLTAMLVNSASSQGHSHRVAVQSARKANRKRVGYVTK